jgi:hypothetical protein
MCKYNFDEYIHRIPHKHKYKYHIKYLFEFCISPVLNAWPSMHFFTIITRNLPHKIVELVNMVDVKDIVRISV